MKITVIATGWHFPDHFYYNLPQQKVPEDWDVDFFCASHRNPLHANEERKNRAFPNNARGLIDSKLYLSTALGFEIKDYGWTYINYPNTVGDWGCANQWLEDYNLTDYDYVVITHDDNYILSDTWLSEVIGDNIKNDEWDVWTNSCGAPVGWLRGSCEIFKSSVIVEMGGRFDIGDRVHRVGITTSVDLDGSEYPDDTQDWNNTVHGTMAFIRNTGKRVTYGSDYYRFSKYLLEGERGYISNTSPTNTASEEAGLRALGII